MAHIVSDFYDELAANFHWMFADWEASMARQSIALSALLERECGAAGTLRVLDCACGIGTQSLGLASRGFLVTGSDLSSIAVDRARSEARARSLELPLYVADMQDLSPVPETAFDAVICMDNSLPHLLSEEGLTRAAGEIRKKLRKGGTFVASIRDYDLLLEERPTVQGPSFHSDAGKRRIVFQLWDWLDERQYMFHLYITRETPGGWQTHHGASVYRAVRRHELSTILLKTGFQNVRWLPPEESGFYQPIVLATT